MIEKKNILKRIKSFDEDLERIQTYIKENFNISSEYKSETNQLYMWTSNIHESMQLVAAKMYVIENMGDDLIEVIFGRE